ncbi:uncharacterized protein BXIN_1582 [Babesia sp. Xinjiang]|uniref:uncharacterized protein n=1 Tax=Babesia sp. Xinjiang TaxID=462227 RepID=UPI000A221287|nr:uncharacterized protein BXIN_1582 [Babesia sp. Xinjiang]ORM42381.1 hypothetical protein BXIN_1582 [Babesia sp. Xinjiang]
MKRIALLTDELNVNDVIPEDENVAIEPPQEQNKTKIGNTADNNKGKHDNLEYETSRDTTLSSADEFDESTESLSSLMQTVPTTNSNRSSFGSTVNSFIGFCNVTRDIFKYRFTGGSESVDASSSNFELSQSQFTLNGINTATQKHKTRHRKDRGNLSKAMSDIAEDDPQSSYELEPSATDTQLTKNKGKRTWNLLRERSMPTSPAKQKIRISLKNLLTRGPTKIQHQTGADDSKKHRGILKRSYEPTAVCYAISTDKTAFCKRLGPNRQNTFNLARPSRIRFTSKHRDESMEQRFALNRASHSGESKEHGQQYTTGSERMGTAARYFGRMMLATKRLSSIWKRNKHEDDASANLFTVTVVNRGSANVFILKYQSHCKNYMDITPDFGWRRIVQEYGTQGASGARNRGQPGGVWDETMAQKSYMYYRESKKTTHIVGLAELAINISCRALILGVAHGIIDADAVPPFINDIVVKQYGEEYAPEISRSQSFGTTEGQGEHVKQTMYFKASFVGLFVTSSIQSILGSEEYKKRMGESKRAFRRDMVPNEQSVEKQTVETNVCPYIPIPDYGWKLLERSHFDRMFSDNSAKCYDKGALVAKLQRIFGKNNIGGLTATTVYSNAVLCKVQPPRVKERKAFVYADVGSVGMNIAEQLYRLESKQARREKLPKGTFGFKVRGQNVAISPCGAQFQLVPEELILNAATLVHEMYITQTCLILKVRFEEILEDLKGLGVDVREQTLKNPTPEEALGLYGLAIQVIFGKTRVDIRPEDVYSQIHVYDSGVEGLKITTDNLEFLKRGIGNLRFWRYCQKLHETLGLPDIERYEIFNPTPESFHRFISAFVVYLRFREALKSLFEDAVARLNFCAEQETQLDDNILHVQKELQNFTRIKEENALDIDASVTDKQRLEQLLLHAKNVFNEHKEEKAKVDAEVERIKLATNDVQLKRTKARHLNESLNEQVVSEPEALSNQKDELQKQDAVQTVTLRTMEEKYEQLKKRNKIMEECNCFITDVKARFIQHMDEVLKPMVENVNAAKTLKTRNETLREQIAHQKHKLDEAISNLNSARQSYEDKVRSAQECADYKIKQARKYADDMQNHAQQIHQVISQKNKEAESVAHELAKREKNVLETFKVIEGYLQKITDASEAYQQSIGSIVERMYNLTAEQD